MFKVFVLMAIATIGLGATSVVPGEPGFVIVPDEMFVVLNAAEGNLEICEKSLTIAATTLVEAQANIDELHLAAITLQQQVKILQGMPGPTVGDQATRAWEEVDGVAGLLAGWAVGTGQCIGLAWVFNQPAMK